MKKSKFKKLIQIPLAFHHQDIHDRLDEMELRLTRIELMLTAIAGRSELKQWPDFLATDGLTILSLNPHR